jgi:hypothetical protein
MKKDEKPGKKTRKDQIKEALKDWPNKDASLAETTAINKKKAMKEVTMKAGGYSAHGKAQYGK